MEIIDHKSRLEDLTGHVMEYLDTRWDLLVLDMTEKTLTAASGIVTGLILTIFGGIALVFASIGTAVWLGQRLQNPVAGYFIIAGIFVVVLALSLTFARNYIRNVVTNSVLESIKDDNEDEKAS
ncbi:MAG TPA: phage holin family protein [Saprospiraceae bacterium]|nr:phage holin family protein [Saprospiraceae bacterium]